MVDQLVESTAILLQQQFDVSFSNPRKKDDRVAIKFADTTKTSPMECSHVFYWELTENPESLNRKLHNILFTNES